MIRKTLLSPEQERLVNAIKAEKKRITRLEAQRRYAAKKKAESLAAQPIAPVEPVALTPARIKQDEKNAKVRANRAAKKAALPPPPPPVVDPLVAKARVIARRLLAKPVPAPQPVVVAPQPVRGNKRTTKKTDEEKKAYKRAYDKAYRERKRVQKAAETAAQLLQHAPNTGLTDLYVNPSVLSDGIKNEYVEAHKGEYQVTSASLLSFFEGAFAKTDDLLDIDIQAFVNRLPIAIPRSETITDGDRQVAQFMSMFIDEETPQKSAEYVFDRYLACANAVMGNYTPINGEVDLATTWEHSLNTPVESNNSQISRIVREQDRVGGIGGQMIYYSHESLADFATDNVLQQYSFERLIQSSAVRLIIGGDDGNQSASKSTYFAYIKAVVPVDSELMGRQLIYEYILNAINNYKQQYENTTYVTDVYMEVIERPHVSAFFRVAKYTLENCMVNILRTEVGDARADKIYEKYPALKPATNAYTPIYIDNDQMEAIAKAAGVKIIGYSAIGARLLLNNHNRDSITPWFTYGYERSKQIHVTVANGHVTILRTEGFGHVDSIKYLRDCDDDTVDILCAATNIIDSRWTKETATEQPMPEYFVQYVKSGKTATTAKNIMYKRYDPKPLIYSADELAAMTDAQKADLDRTYAYCCTPSSALLKKFKLDHIDTGVLASNIRSYRGASDEDNAISRHTQTLLIAAEHFIGRRLVTDNATYEQLLADGQLTEHDHNKNYVSYDSGSLGDRYIGFPDARHLTPTKYEHAVNPAFYVYRTHTLREIPSVSANIPFVTFYLNTSEEYVVLPAPTTQYFLSKCTAEDRITATAAIEYVLDTPHFSKVSVIGWCDAIAARTGVPPAEMKLMRNKLIGMTITGGLKLEKSITFEYDPHEHIFTNDCGIATTPELERMQADCIDNGIPFTFGTSEKKCAAPAKDVFKAYLPHKVTGAFSFHSYILAYAALHMMDRWAAISAADGAVVAYNVDALVTTPTAALPTGDAVGEWKMAAPKSYYRQLKPRTVPVTQTTTHSQAITALAGIIVDRKPIYRDTLILGPAGIGKSYPYVSAPYPDQIILTPTHDLKNEHVASGAKNVATAAKYFQFTLTDDKWKMLREGGRIPRQYKYVVLDEITMYDAKQWATIMRRKGDSILIGLGDFSQICTNISASAICEDSSVFANFDRVNISRTPDTVARHSYEYGQFLDKMRGMSATQQTAYIRDAVESGYFAKWAGDYSPTYRFITGKHDVNEKINKSFIGQPHLTVVPLRALAGGRKPSKANKATISRCYDPCKKVYTTSDSGLVWWTRRAMTDTPGANHLFRPAYATTVDSYQGATLTSDDAERVIIDLDSLTRHGCLYTAITRAVSQSQICIRM